MFDSRDYARRIVDAQKRREEYEREKMLSMIEGDSFNVCYSHIPTWGKKHMVECLLCKKKMNLT